MERVLDFHHYFLRLLVKVTTFIRSHSYVTVMSDRAVEGNCHLGENGTSFPTILPEFSISNSIYSRHLKIVKYLSIKRMNRNCHFWIEKNQSSFSVIKKFIVGMDYFFMILILCGIFYLYFCPSCEWEKVCYF